MQELTTYVPDCDITSMDDGRLLVTHLASGRVRTAQTARQALIVGTGLAIAHTWRQEQEDDPCADGCVGPFDVDPGTATKTCQACGLTMTWG